MGRKTNFELLRIICMFLIVMGHYGTHGGALRAGSMSNRLISGFAGAGTYMGVNCFIMISAYFLIDKSFQVQRIWKIEKQVLFYAIVLFTISVCLDKTSLTGNNMVQSLFPSFTSVYWFSSAYIGLLLLQPVLNYIISLLAEDSGLYKKVLWLLFVMFSVIPFLGITYEPWSSDLGWFLFLYFLTGYIKINGKVWEHKDKGLKIFLSVICVIFLSEISMWILAEAGVIPDRAGIITYLALKKESPFQLLGALGLFVWARELPDRKMSWINFVASHTFGIYLFHDHFLFREILWKKFLRTNIFYTSNSFIFILHLIFSSAIIFGVGIVIDFLRLSITKLIPTWKKKDIVFQKINAYWNIH